MLALRNKINEATRETIAIVWLVDIFINDKGYTLWAAWLLGVIINIAKLVADNAFVIVDCVNDKSNLYTKLLPTLVIQLLSRFLTAMGQTPSQQIRDEIRIMNAAIAKLPQAIQDELKDNIKEELRGQREDIVNELSHAMDEHYVRIKDDLHQNHIVIKAAIRSAFDNKIDDIAQTVMDEMMQSKNFNAGVLDKKYIKHTQRKHPPRSDSAYHRTVQDMRRSFVHAEASSSDISSSL